MRIVKSMQPSELEERPAEGFEGFVRLFIVAHPWQEALVLADVLHKRLHLRLPKQVLDRRRLRLEKSFIEFVGEGRWVALFFQFEAFFFDFLAVLGLREVGVHRGVVQLVLVRSRHELLLKPDAINDACFFIFLLVVAGDLLLCRVVVAVGSWRLLLALHYYVNISVFLLLFELAYRELSPVSDLGVLG